MSIRCIAHKKVYGIELRCTKDHKHKGNHRWAKDDGIYPFGRLDPDSFIDQAFVEAFNRGAKKAR